MNLLVAYSGSPGSERLLEHATQRAKAVGAKVLVVTSLRGHGQMPSRAASFFGGETPARAHGATWEDRYTEDILGVERGLEKIKDRFRQEGLECSTHALIRGESPDTDIVEFATRHKVDEIVIGSKKRSSVSNVLFGATARHIIENAPCPVVTIWF